MGSWKEEIKRINTENGKLLEALVNIKPTYPLRELRRHAHKQKKYKQNISVPQINQSLA